MKRCAVALAIFALISTKWCPANEPTQISDLCRERIRDILRSKNRFPLNLRTAMARAFRENTLEIADPREPFQETDFVAVEKNKKRLPTRRLLFAFRTEKHFVVYYESSSVGLGANALVFSNDGKQARMVWGGVEEDHDKLATNPAELMRRICNGRLISDRAFFW